MEKGQQQTKTRRGRELKKKRRYHKSEGSVILSVRGGGNRRAIEKKGSGIKEYIKEKRKEFKKGAKKDIQNSQQNSRKRGTKFGRVKRTLTRGKIHRGGGGGTSKRGRTLWEERGLALFKNN